MSYRYFFQGFEGARQVQSMMIDFMPDLCFLYQNGIVLHLNLHAESLAENHYFDLFAVGKSKLDFERQNVRIYANDTETKIFVAPESEGFFEPKQGDEYIMDMKPYPLYEGGCPDFRDRKRIYMPKVAE